MAVTLAGAVSEEDLSAWVVDAARLHGWRVWFQPDWVYRLIARDMERARRRRRWPDPGFPDLWLVHPERGLLVLELKSARGTVRPEQREWLDLLRAAGVDAQVVRPDDRDELERRLAGVPG